MWDLVTVALHAVLQIVAKEWPLPFPSEVAAVCRVADESTEKRYWQVYLLVLEAVGVFQMVMY
jgi:hypothetical protein